jgi:hypothetical protein
MPNPTYLEDLGYALVYIEEKWNVIGSLRSCIIAEPDLGGIPKG